MINKAPLPLIILFYMKTCPHCKILFHGKPSIWGSVSNALKGKYKFVAVERENTARLKIVLGKIHNFNKHVSEAQFKNLFKDGFPTIVKVNDEGIFALKSPDHNTVKNLDEWLNEHTAKPVVFVKHNTIKKHNGGTGTKPKRKMKKTAKKHKRTSKKQTSTTIRLCSNKELLMH